MSVWLKGRRREVAYLVNELEGWAVGVVDLRGVGIVGSYAYGRPRLSSDLDLVLLTGDPERYGPWLGTNSPLAPARLLLTRSWGPLTEWRFRRRSGLQLDVGVTAPSWAVTHPLDPGTARVIRDGLRIAYDPDGLLERAQHWSG